MADKLLGLEGLEYYHSKIQKELKTITNNVDTQIGDITDGTTTVGNADKLDGKDADYFETEIGEKVESEPALDFGEAKAPEFQENIDSLNDKVDELKSDLSEVSNNLNRIVLKKLRNGCDYSDVENGYWNRADGYTVLPADYYYASNTFVEVKPNTTYYAYYRKTTLVATVSVGWYDEEHNYLGFQFNNGTEYVAPENAKYARLSWSTYGVNEGEMCFSEYTPNEISAITNYEVFGYDESIAEDLIPKQTMAKGKLCVSGDSICYGVGYVGGYAKIIADNNNMTYQNIGVSGATIASNVPQSNTNPSLRYSIAENMGSLDDDGNYYIIEGGYNDYNQNVPLFLEGVEYSDELGTTKRTDLTTIYYAMESICYDLVVNHAGKKIGFVFPHKITYTDFYPNAIGVTYSQYKDLQKKVLKKWGVPFIDLGEVSGMDTRFESITSLYTHNGDTVHPNELGYRTYYCDKITAWLATL